MLQSKRERMPLFDFIYSDIIAMTVAVVKARRVGLPFSSMLSIRFYVSFDHINAMIRNTQRKPKNKTNP